MTPVLDEIIIISELLRTVKELGEVPDLDIEENYYNLVYPTVLEHYEKGLITLDQYKDLKIRIEEINIMCVNKQN